MNTTFYLYLCVFYRCSISYKHVMLNWHKMPPKKDNNLEKYSPKPGIEPELSRPKQNHYIHSPIAF